MNMCEEVRNVLTETEPEQRFDVESLHVVHGNTEPKLITNKSLMYFDQMFRFYYKIFYKENKLLFFDVKESRNAREIPGNVENFLDVLDDLKISDIFDLQFIAYFFKLFQDYTQYLEYDCNLEVPQGIDHIKKDYINLILQIFANKRVFDTIEQLFLLSFFRLPNNKQCFVENFKNNKNSILQDCYVSAMKDAESYLKNVYKFDESLLSGETDPIHEILLIYTTLYLKLKKCTADMNGKLEIKQQYYNLFLSIRDDFILIQKFFTLNEWCDNGNRLKDYLEMMEFSNKFISNTYKLEKEFAFSSEVLRKVINHVTEFLDYRVKTTNSIKFVRLIRHPELIKFQPRYYFINNSKNKQETSKPKIPVLFGVNTDDVSDQPQSLSSLQKEQPRNEVQENKTLKYDDEANKVEVISIYYFREMKKLSLKVLEQIFSHLNKKDFTPLSIENYWNIDKTILDLSVQNKKKVEGNLNFKKHPEKYVDIVIELEFGACVQWLMNRFQGFTESDIESILVQTLYDYDHTVQILEEVSKGNFEVLESFVEDTVNTVDTSTQITGDIQEEALQNKEQLEKSGISPSLETSVEVTPAEGSYKTESSSENVSEHKITDVEDMPISVNSLSVNGSPKETDCTLVSFEGDVKGEIYNDADAPLIDYNAVAIKQIQNFQETYPQFLSKLFGINSESILNNFDQDKKASSIFKDLWIQHGIIDGFKTISEEYDFVESFNIPLKIKEKVEISLDYNELKIWKEMFPKIPNHILKEKYYAANGNNEALLLSLDEYLASNPVSDDILEVNNALESLDDGKRLYFKNKMKKCIQKSKRSNNMSLKEAQVKADKEIKNDEHYFNILKNKVSVLQNYMCLTLQFSEYCLFMKNYDFVDATLFCLLDYQTISADLKKKFENMKDHSDYDSSFNLIVCKSYDIKSKTPPKFRTPQLFPQKRPISNPEMVLQYLYFVENIQNLKLFNRNFVLKVFEYMNFKIQTSINLLILLSNLGKIDYINSKTSYLTRLDIMIGLKQYAENLPPVEIESLDSPLIETIERETIKVIKRTVKKTREVEQPILKSGKNYEFSQNRSVIDDTITALLPICTVKLSNLDKPEALYLVALAVEKWWSEECRQRTFNQYVADRDLNHTLCHYTRTLKIIMPDNAGTETDNKEICELLCQFLTSQDFLISNNENHIEVVGTLNKVT